MINSAKEKGILEGIEQGIERGKIDAAISFLDILDDEIIANKLGLDINVVRGLRK
ncbi:MAG: hypothetical protein ACRCWG_15485 [Sarcina sp.]